MMDSKDWFSVNKPAEPYAEIERLREALRVAREYIEEDAREECGPKWRDDVLVAIDAVLKEDGE